MKFIFAHLGKTNMTNNYIASPALSQVEMERNDGFDLGAWMDVAQGVMAAAAAAHMAGDVADIAADCCTIL